MASATAWQPGQQNSRGSPSTGATKRLPAGTGRPQWKQRTGLLIGAESVFQRERLSRNHFLFHIQSPGLAAFLAQQFDEAPARHAVQHEALIAAVVPGLQD